MTNFKHSNVIKCKSRTPKFALNSHLGSFYILLQFEKSFQNINTDPSIPGILSKPDNKRLSDLLSLDESEVLWFQEIHCEVTVQKFRYRMLTMKPNGLNLVIPCLLDICKALWFKWTVLL